MKRYVLYLCTTALICAGFEGVAYGQASALGASFQIYNPGSSRGSAVAYDTRNNVYLAVSAYGGVTAQFVSADGVGLASCGGPFVLGGNVFAHFPRVAYSPDANGGLGGFVVTWHDGDSPVGGNAVHARAVSLSSCLGPDRIISNTVDGSGNVIGGEKTWWEAGPAIAYASGSQRFLVVWRSIAVAPNPGATVNDIGGRLLDLTGAPLGSGPIRVTATSGTYEDNPSVAYNPSTNQFLVAYAGADTAAFMAARTVSAADGSIGAYYELMRGAGTYITDTTFVSATGKFLVAWFQAPGGSTGEFVDGATGVPDGNVIPLSTRFAANDALSIAYNPISRTSFMVSHDQFSFQDGGLEIGPDGVPGPGFGATFILDKGNFYPRIASSSVEKKWMLVTSQGFGAIWGQFIQTSSSGSGSPPPSSPPPAPAPTSPVTMTGFTSNVTFPVSEGTPITWTAAATGGTALQYQFITYTAARGWVTMQPYSSNNTFTWFPPAGSNALQVWVRSSGSSNPYDAYGSTGFFTVLPPAPKLTSFTSNVAFPATFNVPITFTATAPGASVEYKFLLYSASTGWRTGREYSPSNTYTWFPPAGQNAIQVWVRSVGSTAAYQDYMTSGMFTVSASPARLTGFAANVAFPTSTNTTITWTATATAGSGPVEYKFLRYDQGLNTWSTMRDWNGSNQFSWTPGVGNSGWSALQVWVRTVGSSAAFEDWRGTDYFLITNSTGLTLSPNRSMSGLQLGQFVTWTANATGTGPWEYAFFTFDGTTWRLAQPYSTQNTFTWFPPVGSQIAIQVWLRAAGSHAAWERYQSSGYFIVNP